MYCTHFQVENLILTCPIEPCQEVNDTAVLLTHKAVRLWSLPSKLLFSIVCSKSSCATCGRLSPGQVRPCVNGLTYVMFHLDISGFSQHSALEVLSFLTYSAMWLTLFSMVVAKEPAYHSDSMWLG